jgi:hypothetical protein
MAWAPRRWGWAEPPKQCAARWLAISRARLAYIKAELKVTDAQDALWNAYAAAARDNAKTMIARCSTMMGKRDSQISLPDRLDQNEQLMAAQLDAMRAVDKALKPLYAALSDGQKKTADQLFWGPMGMM